MQSSAYQRTFNKNILIQGGLTDFILRTYSTWLMGAVCRVVLGRIRQAHLGSAGTSAWSMSSRIVEPEGQTKHLQVQKEGFPSAEHASFSMRLGSYPLASLTGIQMRHAAKTRPVGVTFSNEYSLWNTIDIKKKEAETGEEKEQVANRKHARQHILRECFKSLKPCGLSLLISNIQSIHGSINY